MNCIQKVSLKLQIAILISHFLYYHERMMCGFVTHLGAHIHTFKTWRETNEHKIN